jgi:hypothetical protein
MIGPQITRVNANLLEILFVPFRVLSRANGFPPSVSSACIPWLNSYSSSASSSSFSVVESATHRTRRIGRTDLNHGKHRKHGKSTEAKDRGEHQNPIQRHYLTYLTTSAAKSYVPR